jgi:hypothetical protein
MAESEMMGSHQTAFPEMGSEGIERWRARSARDAASHGSEALAQMAMAMAMAVLGDLGIVGEKKKLFFSLSKFCSLHINQILFFANLVLGSLACGFWRGAMDNLYLVWLFGFPIGASVLVMWRNRVQLAGYRGPRRFDAGSADFAPSRLVLCAADFFLTNICL